MSIEKRNHDDAVSPVVGVMLMLVVTIVIAAVVAAFSTGVIGSTTATPTAIIEVVGSDNGDLVLMHKGGDVLNTKDISILLQDTSDEGVPKEYTTSGGLYTIEAKTLSTGDTFFLHNIGLPADTPANIKIIDKKSGNTIASSTFIMPAGVKSTNGDATPTFVVLSTYLGSDYPSSASFDLTTGTKQTFYINAYDEEDQKISVPTDAYVTVTKSGGEPEKVRYSVEDYGYSYTFSDAGTYTITATVNGVSAGHHGATGFDAMNGVDTMKTTASIGGSYTVTVTAASGP